MILYKYTSLKYIELCIENGIYASKLEDVNDPYESYRIRYPKQYRICCLSSSYKKMLLWSYYTRHKGCVIAYELPDNCKIIRRIKYINNLIDYSELDESQLFNALYTKGSEWEHENEWRIVYKDKEHVSEYWNTLENNDIYFKAKVKKIYLGALSSKDELSYLDCLEKIKYINEKSNNQIEVNKMMLSNKKYQLVIDKQFDYLQEIKELKKTKIAHQTYKRC